MLHSCVGAHKRGKDRQPMDTASTTPDPDTTLSAERLQRRDWETILDEFTEDMDPWAIDIVELAERYKRYIQRLDRYDLEIPARMLVVCSVLLRMKVALMQDDPADEPEPMDEEPLMDEVEEDPLEGIHIPDETVEPPVQNKGKRRVSLDELKDALDNALDIHEKRQTRRTQRREEPQDFIDIDETDITSKLDNLMDRLTSFFSRNKGAVRFKNLLQDDGTDERLETFIHVLHLETEEKVRCQQEVFLGDIEIYPEENS